jgi:hypothetical protein
MDVVRVHGNMAIHAGQIDDDDNSADDAPAVATLAELVNYLVEEQITKPKNIAKLYAGLPDDKRIAAENRNKPR